MATEWDAQTIWEKAKLFVARAEREEQEGDLFPFWSILGLELLGRAVLAAIHPALLADPREPDNIFFAFGISSGQRPRSITARTVFKRCTKVIDDFTDKDANTAIGLIEFRNEELHGGGTPFDSLGTAVWLADYYRICQLLLQGLDRELDDLFGQEQAKAAQIMIDGVAERLISEANEEVALARRSFEALPKAEQRRRRKAAATRVLSKKQKAWEPHRMGKTVKCPACDSQAWITGEFVRSGKPVASEDVITHEIVKIPTYLECLACGLGLDGHGRLHAIGLGGLYTGEMQEDPISYFGIEFEPSEEDLAKYYEDDYGNE
jgi:hypothetical protein